MFRRLLLYLSTQNYLALPTWFAQEARQKIPDPSWPTSPEVPSSSDTNIPPLKLAFPYSLSIHAPWVEKNVLSPLLEQVLSLPLISDSFTSLETHHFLALYLFNIHFRLLPSYYIYLSLLCNLPTICLSYLFSPYLVVWFFSWFLLLLGFICAIHLILFQDKLLKRDQHPATSLALRKLAK